MEMKTQRLSLDRISALPDTIIEHILTLMPIRDATKTSILSKKWRYSWRSMPKLVFTDDMVEVEPIHDNGQLKKYKLANAIFQVVLFHNGPAILVFNCWVRPLVLDSEFSQTISYLAMGNTVKELIFINDNFNKLPVSFFSLQGLELIQLVNCTFVPPSTFDGFSRLKSMTFFNVKVSAQMLRQFLCKCPLLEHITLKGYQEGIHFVTGENKFTFFDLLKCVPLIRSLEISIYYMKYLSAGGMPRKLPTSLVHLKHLSLVICMAKQNDISSALCIIRSSPLLAKISFKMYDDEKLRLQQNSTNVLDPDDFSDLNVGHLETLEIERFSNLPLEMEFVKLIMAKAPVLKKVRIELDDYVSVDEELKILRDLVHLPFPRAPTAKLTIRRSEAC
ncbi:hypothetical protein SSX86_027771 [Deinandra increscens subsp. villosa]|uniref:F-box domain-containing protein n=1 Tax=Deinandra increscens subsp. villosa TaxID=3103831 RepID=A0AAP0C7F8_9ASTR